jgi:fibrillarin-like pre-rRNA processing protein
MREIFVPNFYEEGGRIFSLSKDGKSIYGEAVTVRGKNSYRLFSPLRSKLSSSIKVGLKPVIKREDHVLYLGAATGTTVSHMSDAVSSGAVFSVEVSPVPFIKLMSLSEVKKNVFPILSDAQRPETFAPFVDRVDLIYQDVSQPNQVDIFSKNMLFYNSKRGIIMLKTFSLRSELSVKEEIRKIEENFSVEEVKDISRFHKGHLAITVSSS